MEESKKSFEEQEESIVNATRTLFAQIGSVSEDRYMKNNILLKYTYADLTKFIECPRLYHRKLIEINQYLYYTSSMYRNIIDYYVKMVLVDRWHVKTTIQDAKINSVNKKKLQQDYIRYVAQIEKLNLKQEIHTILLTMFLEDAVFGFWLRGDEQDVLYYLPHNWCEIRGKTNGLWSFHIDVSKIPFQKYKLLPEELKRRLKKHLKKSGDDALYAVPFQDGFCAKWNSITDEIYPPMTSIIENILRIKDYKQLDQARTELDAWTLLSMLIPMKDGEQNHLLLTEKVISQFVTGAQNTVPSQVGVIPTPMKIESIPLNKNSVADKDKVKEATDQYNKETGVPAALMGEGKSGSIVSLTIKKDSAVIFNCLDQISNIITLKMKLDGFDTNRRYSFVFKQQHITVFNEAEKQKQLALNANQGSPNKFEWYGSQGISANEVLGQCIIENDIFKDVFDNMTVLPSQTTHAKQVEETINVNRNPGTGVPRASTNITDSTLGRPRLDIEELSPEGEATRENDSNNPANRM